MEIFNGLKTLFEPKNLFSTTMEQRIQMRPQEPADFHTQIADFESKIPTFQNKYGNSVNSNKMGNSGGLRRVISASEALERRQKVRRNQRLRASMSGQKDDKPEVVFFPTSGNSGQNGGCQDASSGGGGFNTFAFISFLMGAFNAVSVVSNNNNNRNNNNNNRNNDNNNNNFQTLESSVMGMQEVMRRKRSLIENPSFLVQLPLAVYNAISGLKHTNNNTNQSQSFGNSTDSSEREARKSPETEENGLLMIVNNFITAWIRNQGSQSKSCHLKNICEANVIGKEHIADEEKLLMAIATRGIIRDLREDDTGEEYLEAADIGRAKQKCSEVYKACLPSELAFMGLVESALLFPATIWKNFTRQKQPSFQHH